MNTPSFRRGRLVPALVGVGLVAGLASEQWAQSQCDSAPV